MKPAKKQPTAALPWRPALALLLVWIGTVSGWNWIWGLLFLSWTVPALYSGRVHLVESVEREHNPLLFWSIVATWVLLSLALIAIDLAGLWGFDHAPISAPEVTP